jgi:hypothetical protein
MKVRLRGQPTNSPSIYHAGRFCTPRYDKTFLMCVSVTWMASVPHISITFDLGCIRDRLSIEVLAWSHKEPKASMAVMNSG